MLVLKIEIKIISEKVKSKYNTLNLFNRVLFSKLIFQPNIYSIYLYKYFNHFDQSIFKLTVFKKKNIFLYFMMSIKI